MRTLPLLFVTVLLAGCASIGNPFASRPPPATNTFIVFFDVDSAVLTPDAKQGVDRAADAIKARHPAQVTIACYPKTGAGNAPNPKMSDPRFDAVEGELIADGVDPQILARAMLTNLDVKAGPAGNRRVEIRLFKD